MTQEPRTRTSRLDHVRSSMATLTESERAVLSRDILVDLARNGDFPAFCKVVFDWTPAPHHLVWSSVLSERAPATAIVCPPGHGKTNQFAVALPLFEIGRDPNVQIAYVHGSYSQAEKASQTVREIIAESADYRAVFPEVEPDKAMWTRDKWRVKRTSITPHPTFQALGVEGPLQGARVHLLICDDVSDAENTLTKATREKILSWLVSTAFTRLTPRDHLPKTHPDRRARAIAIMTRWHRDDAYAAFLDRWPDLRAVHMPAYGYRELSEAVEIALSLTDHQRVAAREWLRETLGARPDSEGSDLLESL